MLPGFQSLADQAIPHEAGHIVVGVALGVPTRGLEVEVYRDGGQLRVGDFATLSKEPIEGAVAVMPPWMLKAYKLTIAGGLAGNGIAGVPAENGGLRSDRQRLAAVGSEVLEALAEEAAKIIAARREVFDHLILLIHQRFAALMASDTVRVGRHVLLSKQDLDAAFQEPRNGNPGTSKLETDEP